LNRSGRNEQRKLTATYLNGIAIAFITVGVLAPMIGLLTGAFPNPGIALLLGAGCIVISIIIHLGARQTLREMEE
jgi:hypothetical protein